jgi:hypothetical protein
VLSSRLIRTRRRGFTIFEAILDDGSGTLRPRLLQPAVAAALDGAEEGLLGLRRTQAARYRRGSSWRTRRSKNFWKEGERGDFLER